MSSRRVLKVAEAIREVVSMAILTELRDPRIENVTVTFVEVAPDLRSAKVHVSVMGDEKKQQLSIKGLQHSAGFLQQKIGNRLDTRYIPRLKFVLDQGVKHSIEVAKILNEVLPTDQDAANSDDEPSATNDGSSIANDGAANDGAASDGMEPLDVSTTDEPLDEGDRK